MPKKTDILSTFINLIEKPIFCLSSSFVILDCNIAAEKIFKIKKNAIIGKSFSVLCPNLDLKISDKPFENELRTNIGKKPLSWDSLPLKKDINGTKMILIGTITHKNNGAPLNTNMKKESAGSTDAEIIKLNQLLIGHPFDTSKSTLEHITTIYRYTQTD